MENETELEQDELSEPKAENLTLLLEPYYGIYYTPVNWEYGKKAKNYIAKIGPGTKYLFKRDFLRPRYIDDCVVFKKDDFCDKCIIEQKCVYIRGSKEEITFNGFFIIHHIDGKIYGEEITQKDALEYFDMMNLLPEIKEQNKNLIRSQLGTIIRKYIRKYGKDVILEVLLGIIRDYFPEPK